MEHVSHKTKKFPGGETTAYVLRAADGSSYAVTVVTRFDSGNYLTNYKEEGMKPSDAYKTLSFYTR